MKASSSSSPTKYSAENSQAPSSGKVLGVPLLSQFYESPELPQIIKNTMKLEWASIGTYLITAAAFALLVYQGLTTVQEVSITVIVPVTTGLDDGYICKNLGRYSGSPYNCDWPDSLIKQAVCNPSSPPGNCPDGKVICPSTLSARGQPGWFITMENVYFESFDDCVKKIGSIMSDTVESPASYVYSSTEGFLNWSPYNGSINIGDDTAVFSVRLSFNIRFYSGLTTGGLVSFLYPTDGSSFCGTDGTNFNSDGSLISNSSVDIFVRTLPSLMLSDQSSSKSSCPNATPETVCQPFHTVGPYSCTKTTKITQPILQVLGSSVSNAATVMTVLSMALAWIIQKMNDKRLQDQAAIEKVAPKPEMLAVPAEPSK